MLHQHKFYFYAIETDEARWWGGRGRSKGHIINGACTVLYTGSAGVHITITNTCMDEAKRRQDDDHNSLIGGFSQACVDVIKRELSEAP